MATPQLYKTTGIILKRINSGEGDKIITVLCEHQGKKRFIGKGIRKINSRRSGHIELFSKTDFLIHRGKSLDYITGATVRHFFGTSYQTLAQVASAYTACEVIDRLIMEGQEHDEAYMRLDRFLTDIATTLTENIPSLTKVYIDDVLTILGYRRKETESSSLGSAIASVERIIQRKIRSINLFSKSGIDVFGRPVI
jgi:DNA repair protein RecO (recombination protein O)